tara:strand:+ start:549 stop:671 length:123 start_codon:yes stop_codon:yes gene_type:complete
MKRKPEPFRLSCFGFLGIILLISGVSSAVFAFYAVIELTK